MGDHRSRSSQRVADATALVLTIGGSLLVLTGIMAGVLWFVVGVASLMSAMGPHGQEEEGLVIGLLWLSIGGLTGGLPAWVVGAIVQRTRKRDRMHLLSGFAYVSAALFALWTLAVFTLAVTTWPRDATAMFSLVLPPLAFGTASSTLLFLLGRRSRSYG